MIISATYCVSLYNFNLDLGMCGMTALVDDESIIGFTLDDCKPDGSYPCLMG